MKAAFYVGNKRFELRSVSPVPPKPDEVRVEVAYCGICGTDLHIFHGKMDQRVGPPQVIGHEMSGVIAEVGSAVTDWAIGDHIVVRPLDWCSECPACLSDCSHICMNLKFMGIDSIGAFQNSWTVKARTLHRVPEGLALDHAALIEPLAVAAHDVRVSQIQRGETAVVLGSGPIGLLIASVLRAVGANVLLCEINPRRIHFAKELGFHVCDSMNEPVVDIVNEMTQGRGADVVFEVTASQAGARLMTQLPKVRGKIVAVGIYNEPPTVDLHRFFWRELRLIGARLYEEEDYDAALQIAAEKSIPFDQFITDIVDLDQIQQGFEALVNNPNGIKTLIRCHT